MSETGSISERLEALLRSQGKDPYAPFFREDKQALAEALDVSPSAIYGAMSVLRRRAAGSIPKPENGTHASAPAEADREDNDAIIDGIAAVWRETGPEPAPEPPPADPLFAAAQAVGDILLEHGLRNVQPEELREPLKVLARAALGVRGGG